MDENEFNSPGNTLLVDYKNATNGKWEASIDYEEVRGKEFFNKPNFLSIWIKSEKNNANILPSIKIQKTDGSFSEAVYFKLNKKNQWENVLIDVSKLDSSIQENPTIIKSVIFSQAENAASSSNKI